MSFTHRLLFILFDATWIHSFTSPFTFFRYHTLCYSPSEARRVRYRSQPSRFLSSLVSLSLSRISHHLHSPFELIKQLEPCSILQLYSCQCHQENPPERNL